MRFALGQHGTRRFVGTDATRLGSICHAVLDRAVSDGVFASSDWKAKVAALWVDAVAAEESRAIEAGITKPAQAWTGYQIKRARLLKVAERLRGFLEELPPGTEVLTEHALSAEGGRLFGRADLILRGEGVHRIIDYKSGGVTDVEGKTRAAYVHQLQLYALLEHADSGSWPDTAHLFPLQGAPVEIDVEPSECIRRGQEALDLLDAFNAAAPGQQPASPSPALCRWCDHTTVCSAFWRACNESWATELLAASGTVQRSFTTPVGGTTVLLDAVAGSVASGPTFVKQIDSAVFPDAAHVSVGATVVVTGLRADEHGGGYQLLRTGGFRAEMPS